MAELQWGNLQPPNIVGNFQQGLQFGQQQRALREQRQDAQTLRRLSPQIQQGDPQAFAQAAAIDPEAAKTAQGLGYSQLRGIEGLLNYMDQAEKSGNPQAAQQVWATQGVPYVRQFSGGAEPTANWAEAKPMLEQVRAKIAMAKAGQTAAATPTGFQELHMKALAAGLQPGTPEYQQAMNIALGREGRAATGGFGFEKVIGADGRERMGRTNPRTGVFEVYDEGSGNFIPMGGGGVLNAPPAAGFDNGGGFTAGSGGPAAARVNVEGMDPTQQQQMAAGISALRQAGVADDVIDAFAASALSRPRPSAANPALGVGPTPGERKFAEESGQQQAQLQYLPEQERIKRESAILQAGGTEAAKVTAEAQAKARTDLPKAVQTADDTIALLTMAKNHPGRATATGLSSRLDPRNYTPGTDAANFKVLLDQLGGRAFLQAFESLKGGGQITEVEGRKATEAMARLNTAQSDEAFEEALDELIRIANTAKRTAIERASGTGTSPARQFGGFRVLED